MAMLNNQMVITTVLPGPIWMSHIEYLRAWFMTCPWRRGSNIFKLCTLGMHAISAICPIHFHCIPIGSMYGIYGNIYHQYTPNVSIYIYHTWILWLIFQTIPDSNAEMARSHNPSIRFFTWVSQYFPVIGDKNISDHPRKAYPSILMATFQQNVFVINPIFTWWFVVFCYVLLIPHQ